LLVLKLAGIPDEISYEKADLSGTGLFIEP
jgi:hypothetical protein